MSVVKSRFAEYKKRLLFVPLAFIFIFFAPLSITASSVDAITSALDFYSTGGIMIENDIRHHNIPANTLPSNNTPFLSDITPALSTYILLPTQTAVTPTRHWYPTLLSGLTQNRRVAGLDIRGEIPLIDEAFPQYDYLNELIENAAESLISEARRVRARSVTFRYAHHETDELVSVVIYASVSSVISRTLVYSINFCPYEGDILTMNQALGIDIIPLAERILMDRIRRQPENYYAASNIALQGRAFYLTDDRLVLLFDEFQLSSTRADVATVTLIRENIQIAELHYDEYYRGGNGYNLRMIPVRDVVMELGYDVIWDDDELSIDVLRGSREIVTMHIGINDYELPNMQSRSLESAPELREWRSYVPITFFDQILPLTIYTIDSDGTITFLSYLD